MLNRLSQLMSVTAILALFGIALFAGPSAGNPTKTLDNNARPASAKNKQPAKTPVATPSKTRPTPKRTDKTSAAKPTSVKPVTRDAEVAAGRYVTTPKKTPAKIPPPPKRSANLDSNIPLLPPRMPADLRAKRKSKGSPSSKTTKKKKIKPAKTPFTVPKYGALVLFEPKTGKILYHNRADRHTFPASLTKMMTAYVIFDAVAEKTVTLESNLIFSKHSRSQPATRVGLKKGIDVTIDTAVRALIIRSANDFAVALAETISGSEAAFIDRMNATARRLGMSRTNFVNPHGLPNPFQVSTARDFAILTTALARDFPQHAGVFSQMTVKIKSLELRTHNSLLRTFEGTDGMKTGFTCASGYNIVASATRDNRRLAVVVIGSLTRAGRDRMAAAALDYGFKQLAPGKPPPKTTLASLGFTGTESDDTLNLQHKTRTWACGNGPKPRKARKRKSKSKKKRPSKKTSKKKKKK